MSSNQFQGGAFHSSFERGKSSGTLKVVDANLIFQGGNQEIQWPLANTKIERGGAADRVLFLTHPDHPDWTLYTTDISILDTPALTNHPDTLREIERIKKKRRRYYLGLATVLLILFFAVKGCLALKEPVIKKIAHKIPASAEIRMGEMFFSQYKMTLKMIENAELNQGMEEITSPLMDVIQDSPYPFKFYLVDSPMVNAAAFPGGSVLVFSGLLLKAETVDEVQGVLAHEISHVTQKHGIRQMMGSAGIYLIVQSLFGDMSGLIAALADQGAFLLTMKYSRDYESEADQVGLEYLYQAGLPLEGMIRFFEKMHEIEKKAGVDGLSELLNFMTTHPATSQRLDRIKGLLEQYEVFEESDGIDFDFKGFQAKIRALTE